MYMRRDEPFKVAVVKMGANAGQSVGIYAFTRVEMGTPTVGIGNNVDLLERMLPHHAEEIASALMIAAQRARGEIPTPVQNEMLRNGRAE